MKLSLTHIIIAIVALLSSAIVHAKVSDVTLKMSVLNEFTAAHNYVATFPSVMYFDDQGELVSVMDLTLDSRFDADQLVKNSAAKHAGDTPDIQLEEFFKSLDVQSQAQAPALVFITLDLNQCRACAVNEQLVRAWADSQALHVYVARVEFR